MFQDKNLIRNFSIISHINHGKSTLADRLIEYSRNYDKGKLNKIMDSLELEQERGITIKLNTARLFYRYENQNYQLNLIDTPGHIDFAHEVSRSLAACEGVILLVDAAQGIQAQTISNLNEARKKQLPIIPVINKIDLKYQEIARVKNEIEMLLNSSEKDICLISAKNNIGIDDLLKQIVLKIPAPKKMENQKLQALIFDAYYDRYQGVMLFVRMFAGTLKKGMEIVFVGKRTKHEVIDLWAKKPEIEKVNQLTDGEVGLMQVGIKNMGGIEIGDTIIEANDNETKPFKIYQKRKPVVFANFFADNNENFKNLEAAIRKIQLNDCSFSFSKTSSQIFGQGYYCGFLGLLHLEIIRDRIIKEENVEVIVTTPSVIYKFVTKNGQEIFASDSKNIPEWKEIEAIEEQMVEAKIWTPVKYLGEIMKLIQNKRGKNLEQKIITETNVEIIAEIPLAEIVVDFFDLLKSVSNGYASFEYEINNFVRNKLVRLDILVNGKIIDAFFQIVAKEKSYEIGKRMCEKLQKLIPQQNFKISIQAAVNNKIIARENVSALRKAVAAKCYGGDISRKKKLWKKQKEGKKRMKSFGNVEIPYKIFSQILRK